MHLNAIDITQLQYELAMSIDASLDMDAMLRAALSALLSKLNASSGSIYLGRLDARDERVLALAIPRDALRNQSCLIAAARLNDALPANPATSTAGHAYLLPLRDIGVLSIVRGKALDAPILAALTPLLDRLGDACISCLQNSERERLFDQLDAVLESVGEGIITVDKRARIMRANHTLDEIFGYERGALIGRHLHEIMPGRYHSAHDSGMARYMQSGVAHVLGRRVELEGLRKDGSVFPVEVFITETRSGGELLFTASIRDISARRDYDRMRDDFVATVSHELRTPLTSVLGWSETLLSEKPGALNDDQRRFVNIIRANGRRLSVLVDEIMTAARIQRGVLSLHRAECQPDALVRQVAESLRPIAQARQVSIELRTDGPAILLLDAARIEQVLINLLSNAIKFSHDGGQVIVHSAQVNGRWRLEVADNGIGIPSEDLPRLYERFFRARTAVDSGVQGTGLGLYICKAIIDAHDGVIDLRSTAGAGTRIWFEI